MRKERGFTLIELMIVIAIIATLAVIAMPTYKDYVRNAADSACLAEARGYAGVQVIAFSQGDAMSDVTWSACSEPVGEVIDGETLAASAYVPANGTITAAPNFTIQSKKIGNFKIRCVPSGSCTLLNSANAEQKWVAPSTTNNS